jgi:hypothetical protein
VIEPGNQNIHNHVMLDGLATYRVDNLSDAVHLIRILLNVAARPRLRYEVPTTFRQFQGAQSAGINEPMTPLKGGGL